MAILPGYDKLTENDVSKAQMKCLATMQYLLTFLFALLLVFVLSNLWNFIIKQGKYRNQPLLMFYILSIILIIFRFYFFIWYLNFTFVTQNSLGIIAPPLVKCMLGLEQTWIMVELSIKINMSVDQVKKEKVSDPHSYERTEKWIRRGQTIVTIFITCFLLATLIALGISSSKNPGNGAKKFWLLSFIEPLLIITAVLLLFSLTFLTV